MRPPPPMPPNLEGVFDALGREVTLLHARWKLFCQLFCVDGERVGLLNRAGGYVFATLQQFLADYIVLAFSRLTDLMEQGRFENLSLERLADMAAGAGEADLGAALRSQIATLTAECGDLRTLRSKLLAHNDLAWLTAPPDSTRPADPPVRSQVDRLLEQTAGIMRAVAAHYGRGDIRYQDTIIPLGDGDALIRNLQGLAH